MGKTLIISSKVREKLAGKQPPVTQDEIVQCFANRAGKLLFDGREQHQSDPPLAGSSLKPTTAAS